MTRSTAGGLAQNRLKTWLMADIVATTVLLGGMLGAAYIGGDVAMGFAIGIGVTMFVQSARNYAALGTIRMSALVRGEQDE